MTATNTTHPQKPTIGALFRDALNASPTADMAEIIDTIIDAIDDADCYYYLRQLLAARYSSEVSILRGRNTPNIRPGVSTKQSLIRDEYWPRFLQQRIATPAGSKLLAEATVEDLRFLANMRRAQANDLNTRANEFSTLADLMEKAKVQYLEQLDSSTASKVLRSAA